MRILSYGTPVFLLFFAYWSGIIQKVEGGGGRLPGYNLPVPSWGSFCHPFCELFDKDRKYMMVMNSNQPRPKFSACRCPMGKREDPGDEVGWISSVPPGGGGRVLPHIGCIGMCRCEVYGFQAVYSVVSGSGIQIRIRIPAAHPHPKIPKVSSSPRALYLP